MLLPSLMRPPAWLRSTYTQLDENIHYGCKWGHRSRLEVVLQWVVERRRLMQDQVPRGGPRGRGQGGQAWCAAQEVAAGLGAGQWWVGTR